MSNDMVEHTFAAPRPKLSTAAKVSSLSSPSVAGSEGTKAASDESTSFVSSANLALNVWEALTAVGTKAVGVKASEVSVAAKARAATATMLESLLVIVK